MSCRLLSVGALGCLSLSSSQPAGWPRKEKAPARGDRTGGFKDRRRGVGGCGEYLPSYLVVLSAASPLAPPLAHEIREQRWMNRPLGVDPFFRTGGDGHGPRVGGSRCASS
jgi:hypothetical protein